MLPVPDSALDYGILLGLLLPVVLLFRKYAKDALSRGIRSRDIFRQKATSKSDESRYSKYVRTSGVGDIRPPCEVAILKAEAENEKNGHENLGSLSIQAGFVPIIDPLAALPKEYAPWDELIAQLPQLIKTQNVRSACNRLPLLDVRPMPDRYLQRAASVIGILSHAYVRLDGHLPLRVKFNSHSEILPASLHIPWAQICERLGRTCTSLTFIDLLLHNFRTTAPSKEHMTLNNSKLLLPTVDNIEEQIFYGIMIELSSKAIPIVRDVVEAHKSVLMDDSKRLEQAVIRITSQIGCMTASMGKVNARSMDPVLWTKTVANLATPWIKGLSGSAGTAHPFFHLMDEFIERHTYDTRVGKEAVDVRSNFPKHWRDFLFAVREVSVTRYIENTNNSELKRVWCLLKAAYAGDEGLLGFHRRKVYGFLAIAFRIGRDSTINGMGARTARESSDEVNGFLGQSRVERLGSSEADSPEPRVRSEKVSRTKSSSHITVHELIQHNHKANGFWFKASDRVYAVTPFMTSHPGGEHVIEVLSGQDATKDLNIVAHISNPAIRRILDRYEIGTMKYRRFSCSAINEIYGNLIQLAFNITEIESVYCKTVSFLAKPMTSADHPHELSAFKMKHFSDLTKQLRGCHAVSLFEIYEVLGGLIESQGSSSVHMKSDVKAIIDDIKSHACNDQPSPPNSTGVQAPVMWETTVEYAEQNRKILGQIKASITNLLIGYESLDTDLERLSEELVASLASGVTDMVRLTYRLGR